MEYAVEVPDAFRNLTQVLDDPLTAALDSIAAGVIALYQTTITSVGAVLTGRFRDTVHVREASRAGDLRERIIASDALYSGIVEFGWIYRARGQASYPARYPALITRDAAGPIIYDAFAMQMTRMAFVR
jgi:hypothetical protein